MVFESHELCNDGSRVLTESHITPVYDANDEFQYFMGVSRNITEKKIAEKALQRSERMLKNIVEHSDQIFFVHDRHNRFTYISPQCKAMLGYSAEEMPEKWTELMTDHPMNRRSLELTEKAFRTGKKQPRYIMEVSRKKGKKRLIELNESPVRDESGQVVSLVGAVRDVTEQIHIQEETENRLKAYHETEKQLHAREKELARLQKEVDGLRKKLGLKSKYK